MQFFPDYEANTFTLNHGASWPQHFAFLFNLKKNTSRSTELCSTDSAVKVPPSETGTPLPSAPGFSLEVSQKMLNLSMFWTGLFFLLKLEHLFYSRSNDRVLPKKKKKYQYDNEQMLLNSSSFYRKKNVSFYFHSSIIAYPSVKMPKPVCFSKMVNYNRD